MLHRLPLTIIQRHMQHHRSVRKNPGKRSSNTLPEIDGLIIKLICCWKVQVTLPSSVNFTKCKSKHGVWVPTHPTNDHLQPEDHAASQYEPESKGGEKNLNSKSFLSKLRSYLATCHEQSQKHRLG